MRPEGEAAGVPPAPAPPVVAAEVRRTERAAGADAVARGRARVERVRAVRVVAARGGGFAGVRLLGGDVAVGLHGPGAALGHAHGLEGGDGEVVEGQLELAHGWL